MLSLSPFYQDLLSALNRGLLMSVALIVPSACGGVLIGIATGAIRAFGIPWMRAVGDAYAALFRGTPLWYNSLSSTSGCPTWVFT